MNKIRVFISRKLTANSIFRERLPNDTYEIIDYSLIEFQLVRFERIPKTDWLFFYSKKGVAYFFEQLQKAQISIPADLKWATIGASTAKALEKRQITPDFVGTGDPVSTTQAFKKQLLQQSVAFVQAQKSKQSVQKLLSPSQPTQSLIVYQNKPLLNPQNPQAQILVFTSPMNVQTYLDNFDIKLSQKVVSIGKTTAKALQVGGVDCYQIAQKPDEYHLAEIILKKVEINFC